MEKKVIRVGITSGDLVGDHDLVIQAAIDYLSSIGGGIVKIGAGVYNINTSVQLRTGVHLEGASDGRTVFKKSPSAVSALLADADLHEQQITVGDPDLFAIGQSVIIRNRENTAGFHDTVATIIAKEGNICYLDREIGQTKFVHDDSIAATMFSVINGSHCSDVQLKNVFVDGNKTHNISSNGCLISGIYLFKATNILIENCRVHDFNGDGISYQACHNITVRNCECTDNMGQGIHPGSGTEHTMIDQCKTLRNGLDGILICWRVRNSTVQNCISTDNRMSGLSIGHKDTFNTIRNNYFARNQYYGIFFRNEPDPMGANFNKIENNTIVDNGSKMMGYVGIRMRGFTNHVTLSNNKISFDQVPLGETIGVCMEEHTRDIELKDNEFINCAKTTHNHWLINEN